MKRSLGVVFGVIVTSLKFCVANVVAAGPAPPPTRTVTLSWSSPDFAVDVRQSTDVSRPTTNWSTIASLNNTNALTLPATSSVSFFVVTATGQFMRLAWDYPVNQVSPSVVFNLYWRPNAASSWTLTTNVSGTNLSTRVYTANNSGQYTLTASNTDVREESPYSNVLSWTNSVGMNLPVRIQSP